MKAHLLGIYFGSPGPINWPLMTAFGKVFSAGQGLRQTSCYGSDSLFWVEKKKITFGHLVTQEKLFFFSGAEKLERIVKTKRI